MLSWTRFLALLLLAVPLSAATIDIDPPNPTSATPVTLIIHEVVSCPPPPQVTRSGNTINIALSPGICLTPPVLATFTLPLGVLQPGDYEVVINPGGRTGYTSFYVREADPHVFVIGQSVGPTTGGSEIGLYASDAQLCFSTDLNTCPIPTVTFNGVPGTVVKEKFISGSFAVITPPNQKGIAEIVVSGPRGTARGKVFRYYDPNEGPLPSMFERVLVPVFASGPGAFGSQWSTEVTVLDGAATDVEPYRRAPVARLASGTPAPLDFGASHPAGVLFFAPLDLSARMQFGSLVRDTSRQAQDWGTEVPIVRDDELRSDRFNLLNVPADSRFRQTLRIYDADSVEGPVNVLIYSMTDNRLLASRFVPLQSAHPCRRFEPCPSDDPATATIDVQSLFPELATESRVRIEIFSLANGHYARHVWAFVTVTNNQTQHVTVITPQ
jgi:hypothetical protein